MASLENNEEKAIKALRLRTKRIFVLITVILFVGILVNLFFTYNSIYNSSCDVITVIVKKIDTSKGNSTSYTLQNSGKNYKIKTRAGIYDFLLNMKIGQEVNIVCDDEGSFLFERQWFADLLLSSIILFFSFSGTFIHYFEVKSKIVNYILLIISLLIALTIIFSRDM